MSASLSPKQWSYYVSEPSSWALIQMRRCPMSMRTRQNPKIFDDARQEGSLWLATEAATDIGWYMHTIQVKTYRQLCNRWHLDRGDDASEVDYVYTGYVLRECIGIVIKALQQLALRDSPEKGKLILVLKDFLSLSRKIITI